MVFVFPRNFFPVSRLDFSLPSFAYVGSHRCCGSHAHNSIHADILAAIKLLSAAFSRLWCYGNKWFFSAFAYIVCSRFASVCQCLRLCLKLMFAYICVFVCQCLPMFVYVSLCFPIYVCLCLQTSVYVCLFFPMSIPMCVYVCLCLSMFAYVCLCFSMFPYMFVYVFFSKQILWRACSM